MKSKADRNQFERASAILAGLCIGDSLFDVSLDVIEELKVESIRTDASGITIIAVGPLSEIEFGMEQLGITVYANRENATQHLRDNGLPVREIVVDIE